MAAKDTYLVFLSREFEAAAKGAALESMRPGEGRQEFFRAYQSRLREGFLAIQPEIDAILSQNDGTYVGGGYDCGVEGAPGQYTVFMVIAAEKECLEKVRAIKGVGEVIWNAPWTPVRH